MTPSRESLARAQVLVVGDAMLDRYWHGAVDRISPEAPVPVVRVTREEERIGAAANVAYNVVRLGARAGFLGVVGDDAPGRRLEQLLRDTGIETHLARDPGLQTTVKLRVICRSQQLLRMDFESEPDHEILASQSETFARLLPQQQAVLFSDYGKGGLAHIAQMIAAARAAGKPVLVDPKAATIRATPAPPSSRPTAPSCSRSSAAGAARPSWRPRRSACGPSCSWMRSC